mmetsp:Transcript_1080/g.3154  ORF Transcript_1080/g.3154 Transcript_1080/m.3154 type:complete len:181 (+) Transcript_1080:145-687(+)
MASDDQETAVAETDSSTSALRDNITRKGKNAYYFAHAKTANGPAWDGKAEPKLLRKGDAPLTARAASFDIHKSSITSYAFSDEGKNVRLYIALEGIGQCCSDQDVALDHSATSFCLLIKNYEKEGKKEDKCLAFNKLTATITNAKFKLKQDRVVLTLTKEDPDNEWLTINDKGSPDHEVL